MSVYRDNSFGPRDFINTEADIHYFDDKYRILEFINRDFAAFDREKYSEWVRFWKVAYLYLSLDIKLYKEAGEFRMVQKYRKLANTMLNAREFGKNVRRKVTNPDA